MLNNVRLKVEEESEDFQDSPDDEEDTRSSHKYLNDLEEEYQARALLDKSKRFFKKGTQSEQIPSQKKRILGGDQLTEDPSRFRKKDLVFVKSSADDTKVSIPGVERPWLFEAEVLFCQIMIRVVCSTPLHPLKKLDDAEPVSRPKTIKSILRLCGSYNLDTNGHNMIITLEREINLRNPQHAFKRCEACGSSTHTITDHYDIEWLKKGEALQAKKAEALKSTRGESSSAFRSKTPTKRDHILKGDIELHFIPTQYQLADIFTKPLDEPTFKRLIVELAKALENSKVSFFVPTGGIYGEVGVNTLRNAIAKALENSKVSFFIPTGGIYGEVRVNTLRNAIGAHYLPYSSEYVATPSIDIVSPWFETIRYEETIPTKGTLKKSLLPPKWSEAIKGRSSERATGSKTGHFKRNKESSSAMDSNLSQTSAYIPVVVVMHKEDQQATKGPTSLRVTSEERANPQPNICMSAFNLNEPI
nr:retrovirus-related Pol polyprotein from transposon TNT 1-94 [Tanacetum cinerariifolium]